MLRDEAHLQDILRASNLALQFIRGITKESFLKDEKTQSSILHQLLIIGEAVRRLSNDFRKVHPNIPWKKISGMRDRLIHGYDEVNLTRVWKTTTQEIPKLIQDIQLLSNK
jgi:uncharacterized protein with HEPN domain